LAVIMTPPRQINRSTRVAAGSSILSGSDEFLISIAWSWSWAPAGGGGTLAQAATNRQRPANERLMKERMMRCMARPFNTAGAAIV